MRYLKTCCCGCTLRTGTLIIGSINLIIDAISLFLICLAFFGDIKTENEEQEKQKQQIHNILIVACVATAIATLISILLLIGAARGLKWLLMPWIITSFLGVLGQVLSPILYFTNSSNEPVNGGAIFVMVVTVLITLAVQIYLLMVVISHFHELGRGERGETDHHGTNRGNINPT